MMMMMISDQAYTSTYKHRWNT